MQITLPILPPNPSTVDSKPPTPMSTPVSSLTPRIAETSLFPCKGVVSHNDFRFAASQCKMLTKIIFINLMIKLCGHLKHWREISNNFQVFIAIVYSNINFIKTTLLSNVSGISKSPEKAAASQLSASVRITNNLNLKTES